MKFASREWAILFIFLCFGTIFFGATLFHGKVYFSKKVKDKYLSVCKTKLKDRHGDYRYNFQIITYPGHEDKSLSERTQLLSHGKINW